MTEQEVIKRAKAALAKQEKLKAQLRQVDADIRQICNDYRTVTKTWIVRPESLKFAVEAREGRRAA